MKRPKGIETETKGRYKGGATRTYCTQRREKQEEPQAAGEDRAEVRWKGEY